MYIDCCLNLFLYFSHVIFFLVTAERTRIYLYLIPRLGMLQNIDIYVIILSNRIKKTCTALQTLCMLKIEPHPKHQLSHFYTFENALSLTEER